MSRAPIWVKTNYSNSKSLKMRLVSNLFESTWDSEIREITIKKETKNKNESQTWKSCSTHSISGLWVITRLNPNGSENIHAKDSYNY